MFAAEGGIAMGSGIEVAERRIGREYYFRH